MPASSDSRQQRRQNSVFIRSLKRERVPRTPVWVMRQAGRYLPEYRAVRERAGSFLNLCQTPELACEVTLQPLARFALDAAILFSDILTVPMAMGMELEFVAGEGPLFAKPLQSRAAINALNIPTAGELDYVYAAASLVRHELDAAIPLIGFAGSPWTVACYAVEGGASKDYRHIKAMLYREPELLHSLLSKICTASIAYLQGQLTAGADVIMIFDTWGGVLSPSCYRQFSLAYMQRIVAELKHSHPEVPVVLFTKNAAANLSAMAQSGAAALGVDWCTELSAARAMVADQVALQGNLDPAVLYADDARIAAEVLQLLQSFGEVGAGSGHVFNLGHGIHQYVEPERLDFLVKTVAKLSPQFHS